MAHGWQSIIFFLLYLGLQQCRPIVCGQILCFLLLGPPICWQNWKSLFCFHALGPSILSLQHSQNHMVMPRFYYYPGLTLAQWATNKYFFCKTLSWVHGLEAAMVAFSIHMLKTHGHCLVWKIMLWLPNNTLYFKKWSHIVVFTCVAY